MFEYFGVTLTFIIIVFSFIIYNILKSNRNSVREARSTLKNDLQKRWNLIPSIIEIVKNYFGNDDSILEKLRNLENEDYDKFNLAKKIDADENLSKVILKVIEILEEYPELKDDDKFKDFKTEISDIENDIKEARKNYDILLNNYNSKLKNFPHNLIALIFGFEEELVN